MASTLASAGSVLALSGSLGTGKTTLVREIAHCLEVDPRRVRSPSFTLVNQYEGKLPIYHVDLYRLASVEEIAHLDLDEYLFGDGITFIEWPERIFAALPKAASLLRLDFVPPRQDRRRLRFWRRLPRRGVLETLESSQDFGCPIR